MPGTPQRDLIKLISPPWLAADNGEECMYNIGLGADALIEKLWEGIRAAMPGYGTATALPYLADDSLLIQGPNETDANFVIRLQQTYDAWQHAGIRRGLM